MKACCTIKYIRERKEEKGGETVEKITKKKKKIATKATRGAERLIETLKKINTIKINIITILKIQKQISKAV